MLIKRTGAIGYGFFTFMLANMRVEQLFLSLSLWDLYEDKLRLRM
jgi:hypothetical protein